MEFEKTSEQYKKLALDLKESFTPQISALTSACFSPLNQLIKDLAKQWSLPKELSETIANMNISLTKDMGKQWSLTSKALSETFMNMNTPWIKNMAEQSNALLENLANINVSWVKDYTAQINYAVSGLSDGLMKSIESALQSSIPYLPEEQQELVRETISKEIALEPKKRLTLEQLVMLVSLLFNILTYLHCFLPDPQLGELIELQKEEIAIEQQAQESANKNSDDFQNTISTLSETICVLNNEIEVLREQTQETNDLENSNVQSDNGQVLNDDHEP